MHSDPAQVGTCTPVQAWMAVHMHSYPRLYTGKAADAHSYSGLDGCALGSFTGCLAKHMRTYLVIVSSDTIISKDVLPACNV